MKVRSTERVNERNQGGSAPRMRWKAAGVCDVCGAGNLNIHVGVIGLLLAM